MKLNSARRRFQGLNTLLSLVLVGFILSSCGDSGTTSQLSKGNAAKEAESESQDSGAGIVVVTDGSAGAGAGAGIEEESQRADSYVVVTSPAKGDEWTQGKRYKIKWKKASGKNVTIYLWNDTLDLFDTITNNTKNDGSYTWKVPTSLTPHADYYFYIAPKYPYCCSGGSSLFTITKASGGGGGGSSLKVSTPNGGESWTTGKSYDLKWSKGNAGANVKIELLKSGKASLTISKKTKNDGKHKWKVPSSVKTGSKYKIRITSSTKKTVTDSSDKNFTITKSGGGGGGGGGGGTCTMYATVIGLDGWTDYPGKKVCVGRTPTDPALVCATTKAADLNRATLKNVPKKKLNIYPCGSRYKYIHGVDALDCDDVFTIHASSEWGDSGAAGKDWDKKCGW